MLGRAWSSCRLFTTALATMNPLELGEELSLSAAIKSMLRFGVRV